MVDKSPSKVVYLATSNTSRHDLLETLFQEHGPALRRFLRVRLALEADREDISQDVYVRLSRMENLTEKLAERPESVRSYLFAIATNLIRDRARRAKVREQDKHVQIDDEMPPMVSITPEDEVSARQRLALMKRALRRVKDVHREAFILSRQHHKSYREIADALGVSVSTVEKYISAVLVVLRKELSL